MKLPNGDQADIDKRKVAGYCLSTDHEDGRHNAHLFQTLLGLTSDDADVLLAALRQAAADGEAAVGKRDQYGQRYVIDFDLNGPAGTATAILLDHRIECCRATSGDMLYSLTERPTMTKPRQPKLLDLVAVTNSPATEPVDVGDVGTVVELLPPDGVEVEFLDRDGRTLCVATLNVNDILVLNRERTKVA